MEDCFYVPLGEDRYRSTVHTSGPWDPGAQHGGPPSALLGRAIERCSPREELATARVTVELLGPVPVAELSVSARVVRPGRSVELVEATLSAAGRDVARARAWRVVRTELSVTGELTTPPPLPDRGVDRQPAGWEGGFLSAVELRSVAGEFGQPGPATVWTRLLVALVADEPLTSLASVLTVADMGNGVSAAFQPDQALFINPELSVHVFREAVGEWVCLDAQTSMAAGGAGLATSVLSDEQGPLGVGAQSLLVTAR